MNKKILIIDDDEAILEIFRAVLLAAGYDITTARSGREGILMARKAAMT